MKRSITPREVFAGLRKVAPSISFAVSWTEDPHYHWDGDGPDPGYDGFVAYDVDVYARAILGGKMVEGRQSLGGVYERPEHYPDYDPDIHGYLVQMLEEALEDLQKGMRGAQHQQVRKAREYLKRVLKHNYEAQTLQAGEMASFKRRSGR
jgi:hypothetical protein